MDLYVRAGVTARVGCGYWEAPGARLSESPARQHSNSGPDMGFLCDSFRPRDARCREVDMALQPSRAASVWWWGDAYGRRGWAQPERGVRVLVFQTPELSRQHALGDGGNLPVESEPTTRWLDSCLGGTWASLRLSNGSIPSTSFFGKHPSLFATRRGSSRTSLRRSL